MRRALTLAVLAVALLLPEGVGADPSGLHGGLAGQLLFAEAASPVGRRRRRRLRFFLPVRSSSGFRPPSRPRLPPRRRFVAPSLRRFFGASSVRSKYLSMNAAMSLHFASLTTSRSRFRSRCRFRSIASASTSPCSIGRTNRYRSMTDVRSMTPRFSSAVIAYSIFARCTVRAFPATSTCSSSRR